ncbi:hypothetical protein QZH41_016744, partial [Actinostola sp. cb2023]
MSAKLSRPYLREEYSTVCRGVGVAMCRCYLTGVRKKDYLMILKEKWLHCANLKTLPRSVDSSLRDLRERLSCPHALFDPHAPVTALENTWWMWQGIKRVMMPP